MLFQFQSSFTSVPAPEVDPNAPKPEGPQSEVLSGPDFEVREKLI